MDVVERAGRGEVTADEGESDAPVREDEAAAAISTRDRAAAEVCSADSTTGRMGELPCGVEMRRHCSGAASLVRLPDSMMGDTGDCDRC